VRLSGNVIDIGVTHLARATTTGAAVSAAVIRQARKQLRISLPLNDLPFRIRLTSAKFGSTGVTVTGGAQNTVLGG
jgi:hypothetical protein